MAEVIGCRQHFGRRGAGLVGGFVDTADVGGDLVGALRDFLDVLRDVARRSALLLNRGGDGGGDFVHLGNRRPDRLDGGDGVVGLLLDRRDLRRNILGRLGGLGGQRLYLGGDDGKPPAGFAGAGRFDRGVERQQVGLRRDILDQ